MSEPGTSNNNQNTRALVSALRSDHVGLRRAAVEILDKALVGELTAVRALMEAFGSTHVTAGTLLRERARVTKSGARKR
jgi:hypothetical protein